MCRTNLSKNGFSEALPDLMYVSQQIYVFIEAVCRVYLCYHNKALMMGIINLLSILRGKTFIMEVHMKQSTGYLLQISRPTIFKKVKTPNENIMLLIRTQF